jgi:hypothetical protein
LYLLGTADIQLVVAAPAATLIAILISKYLNKPTVSNVSRLRNL